MRDATSYFPQVETTLVLLTIMADNFHGYNETVQSHLGGGSSDVTDRQRLVESCNHLSVFWTSFGNVLSWLELLVVLTLTLMQKLLEVGKSQ